MLNLSEINNNPYVLEFIRQSEIALKQAGYTEHGTTHSKLVSDRARTIAREIGLAKGEQELSAIAGFCHDMGSFLSRSSHHYFSALLFSQVFLNDFLPEELAIITSAITNHDKEQEMNFFNPESAIVVIADKSDVRRSRVVVEDIEEIKKDIHDRVNYATKSSKLKVDKTKKTITLVLKIDTSFVQIMEYFEIFTERMAYCRKAAEYLGYKFGLVINHFKLL